MHHSSAMLTARAAAGAVVPTAPSNPSATQLTSTSVRFTWTDNSSNEDEFVIYRNKDGGSFSQLTTVGANTEQYDDTGLTSGVKYGYKVAAKNEQGESSKTSAVYETPTDSTPDAPTNFSLSRATDPTELTASWTDNSDNEDGFRVIDEADGSVVKEVGAGVTSATLTSSDGIDPATEYTLHVDAYNTGGSSSSNSDTEKTALEPPVLDFSEGSSSGYHWVELDWTEPNANSKRSEWGVYKNGSLYDTVPDSDNSAWGESGVSPGDEYYVTARGSFPESDPSNKGTVS